MKFLVKLFAVLLPSFYSKIYHSKPNRTVRMDVWKQLSSWPVPTGLPCIGDAVFDQWRIKFAKIYFFYFRINSILSSLADFVDLFWPHIEYTADDGTLIICATSFWWQTHYWLLIDLNLTLRHVISLKGITSLIFLDASLSICWLTLQVEFRSGTLGLLWNSISSS